MRIFALRDLYNKIISNEIYHRTVFVKNSKMSFCQMVDTIIEVKLSELWMQHN